MSRPRPKRSTSLKGLLGNAQSLTEIPDDLSKESAPITVPISQISPYAKQPRRSFHQSQLDELTESIKQKGILQPLLVRLSSDKENQYEIAAGERRYRAAIQAELLEVPIILRNYTDEEMLEVGLIENLQRSELSIIDEVEGTLRLIGLRLNLSPEEAKKTLMTALRQHDHEHIPVIEKVFQATGESWQSFAKNKVRILNWPTEILEVMREEGFGISIASVLAAASEELRPSLIELARNGATIQELRKTLKANQTKTPHNPLEQTAKTISQTLGKSKWLKNLDPAHQEELEQWMAKRPTWMDD